jgi:putative peptidoglycan lipid II flippase
VAQAVLPSMSRQAAAGEMDALKDSLGFGLRLTLFVTIPAALGLMVCAVPIFSLLFMGGKFDYPTAVKAGEALLCYSVGLSCVALARVLVPAFYSLKDTRTPVVTAFIAFLLNLLFSLLLMGPLLHAGLALASSLSALGNMLLLLVLLRRKLGPFGGRDIGTGAFKAFLASLPMAAVVWWGVGLLDWSLPGEKLLKAGVLGGSIVVGVAVFIGCSLVLRCTEAQDAAALIRRRLGRNVHE